MVARLARLARLASTLTATIFGSTSTSVHDVYSSRDSTTPGRAVSWPSIARPSGQGNRDQPPTAARHRLPLPNVRRLPPRTTAPSHLSPPDKCPPPAPPSPSLSRPERHDHRRALNHRRRRPRVSVGPAFCVLCSVQASCFVAFKPRTFSAPHQKTGLTRMRLNFIV